MSDVNLTLYGDANLTLYGDALSRLSGTSTGLPETWPRTATSIAPAMRFHGSFAASAFWLSETAALCEYAIPMCASCNAAAHHSWQNRPCFL
jgi:hypothetical protein